MESTSEPPQKRGYSGRTVLIVVLVTLVAAISATFWVVRTYIYPADFSPVQLTSDERQVLDDKLNRLGGLGRSDVAATGNKETDEQWLREAPYSEDDAARRITLSERELNGLIGRDPELGRRMALDLSDDLASARMLVTVPPDFPVMAGRTIRVNAGLELSYADARPIVRLRGVSIMGVPVPNAWLGNLKNVDLVREFGGQKGFWKSFAAGIDRIRVEEGKLAIQLRE